MSTIKFQPNDESCFHKSLGISEERVHELVDHFESYMDTAVKDCAKLGTKDGVPGIKIEFNIAEMLIAFIAPARTREEFAWCAFHAGVKCQEVERHAESVRKLFKKEINPKFDDSNL
jgi:hypothetical protein